MRAYDGLPPPLRRWLAEAALPWSPASCRRIWLRARARGEPMDAVLARLDRAQLQALSKDPACDTAAGHPDRSRHQDLSS
jgi:hypothetical protein